MEGSFRFVWEYHRDGGWHGWRPMWSRDATPSDGNVVAHDILEHDTSLDIDNDSEAEALGAALWLRGGNNMLRTMMYPEPWQHLGGDVARLFEERFEWGEVTKPPRTLRVDDWAESQIEQTLERAKYELAYQSEYNGMPERAWWNWVRARLRRGCRAAQKRFEDIGQYAAGCLFEDIKDKVNHIRHAEEGDELLVIIKAGSATAIVRHIERWDEEHSEYEPWGDDDEE